MKIKKIHRDKFIKIANNFNKLMKDIQEYYPDACYYVAMDEFNLMSGVSHNQYTGDDQQQNIVESVTIKSLSCGDW